MATVNYGGGYDGAVTLKDAMAQSINTVAVQVSERIGRQKVIDTARRLESRRLSGPIPAWRQVLRGIARRTDSAYGVIANGGVAVWPHAITEIRTRNGKIHCREGAATQVVDPRRSEE